jgi:pentatricopeptide repeat protein
MTLASKYFHKINDNRLLKPSMGMFDALVQVQLAAGDSIVAWKTLAESLKTFKTIRSRSTRIHVPIGMARALVSDLKGKHIDYLRDRMRVAFIPLAHRGEILARLMYAALNSGVETESGDLDLSVALYQEYFEENGCGSASGIPMMAHINAIKAYGKQGNIEKAHEIFKSCIDDSFERELDVYIALLEVLAYAGKVDLFHQTFQELLNAKVELSAVACELLLSVTKGDSSLIQNQLKGFIACPTTQPQLTKAFPFSNALPKLK